MIHLKRKKLYSDIEIKGKSLLYKGMKISDTDAKVLNQVKNKELSGIGLGINNGKLLIAYIKL